MTVQYEYEVGDNSDVILHFQKLHLKNENCQSVNQLRSLTFCLYMYKLMKIEKHFRQWKCLPILQCAKETQTNSKSVLWRVVLNWETTILVFIFALTQKTNTTSLEGAPRIQMAPFCEK